MMLSFLLGLHGKVKHMDLHLPNSRCYLLSSGLVSNRNVLSPSTGQQRSTRWNTEHSRHKYFFSTCVSRWHHIPTQSQQQHWRLQSSQNHELPDKSTTLLVCRIQYRLKACFPIWVQSCLWATHDGWEVHASSLPCSTLSSHKHWKPRKDYPN